MLKSRRVKRGRIIRGKTNRRRQRGGFNLRDNVQVSLRGIVSGTNADETVNVSFYDKNGSKSEVRNIPNSNVTFIRPGKEFRVRPITEEDELVLYGTTDSNPGDQGSRFKVKPLPS